METKLTEFLNESNAIEGVYDYDSLTQAIYAWEYLVSQNELTLDVILKTHKILMLNQMLMPNEKGYFRTVSVRVGSRICLDHRQIKNALKHLLSNIHDMIDNGQKEPDVFKERVTQEHHIAYEEIHPFIDGNGRTGRMILNWERLKLGLPLLVIKESKKQDYYKWFK